MKRTRGPHMVPQVGPAGFRSGHTESSVATRPIEGGFITRISHFDGDSGEASHREVFSKERPRVHGPEIAPEGRGSAGKGSLRAAVKENRR